VASIARITASVLALALGGCVTQPVELAPANVEPTGAAPPRVACSAPNFVLTDARERTVLGRIGAHELTYPALADSVDAALRREARLVDAADPVRLTLVHAYLDNHPSGHSINLVARTRRADEPERVLRGVDSGVTWWGSRDEFGAYVRTAAQQLATRYVEAYGRCEAR
jgi:hypothetical protein